MQKSTVESYECARTAEIAKIIEIGREAGNHKHRGAEAWQSSLPGTCERERRKCVCERFHRLIPQGMCDSLQTISSTKVPIKLVCLRG